MIFIAIFGLQSSLLL